MAAFIYFIIVARNTRALKRFSSWGPFFSIVTLKLKWEIKIVIAIAAAAATKMFSACFSFSVCVCVCVWRENPLIREWWTFWYKWEWEWERESEWTNFYSPLYLWCCRHLKTFKINWFLIDMPCPLTKANVCERSSASFFHPILPALLCIGLHCIVLPSCSYFHVQIFEIPMCST